MVSRTRQRRNIAVDEHRSTTLVTTSVYTAGDKENGEEYEDQTFEVHQFVTDPAYVRVQAGVTKSLGKNSYEFIRVDVSISKPCYVEQIDSTYKEVADKVANLLDAEIAQYLEAEGV